MLAALLAAACAAPRVPLVTYGPGPPDASPAGTLLEGKLGIIGDSPCVVMLVTGEAPIGLAWPPGYTATVNPLRVFNESGAEVAAEGVQVTVTGEIDFEPNATCRTQSAFRVDQVFEGTLPPASYDTAPVRISRSLVAMPAVVRTPCWIRPWRRDIRPMSDGAVEPP